MPYYQLRNKKTGAVVEKFLTISEGDAWEESNPEWERVCGAPGFGDAFRLGLGARPSDAFRDRIKEIKKTHKKGTL